jgi:hypothetical protein
MDMHAANAAFRRFGDIAGIEKLPSDVQTAVVSFFDVRAATRAMEFLGSDWCWPGDQCGERTAWLPGTMQLSADELQRVSNARRDPACGDGYLVEFFDVRDAARVAAMGRRKAQAPKVAEAPEQASRPDAIFGTASAGLTHAAASHENTEQSVLLQGLPNALCSRPCFEAMLQQAGLQREVVSQSARPGSPCGEAVLKFVDRGAVARCIKHFHGRAWDPSGTLVSATRMAPPPGLWSATKMAEPRDHMSGKQVPPPPGLPPPTKLAPMPSLLSAKRLAPPCFMKGAVEAAVLPPPGLGGLSATKDADTEQSTDAGASEADDYRDEYLGEMCSTVF